MRLDRIQNSPYMFLLNITWSDLHAFFIFYFFNLFIFCTSKVQSTVLSSEAKDAAVEIEHRLQLGSKLSDLVNSKEDVLALLSLYKDEGYIFTEHKGRFCVSKLSLWYQSLYHLIVKFFFLNLYISYEICVVKLITYREFKFLKFLVVTLFNHLLLT